ncbi:MAG: 3',5'-cyclic-AMP phosphodiesterase [Gammaproteobacteria bacterium]
MSTTPAATLLQITDFHIMPNEGDRLHGVDTEKTFHAMIDQAFAEHDAIDAILVTGDLTQDPYPPAYRRILKKLETFSLPCLCLPGNHDDYDMMRQILNSGSVSCQKQFFLSNWQIICLNSLIPGSPGGHLTAEELEFLEDCLKKHPNCPTLVAVHHHCLKTGSLWMDSMMIDNSTELFSVSARYPQVKAITYGHIHQLFDAHAHSTRILGTPSTCFQFKPKTLKLDIDDKPPAYRIIEFYGEGRIETKVFNLWAKEKGISA